MAGRVFKTIAFLAGFLSGIMGYLVAPLPFWVSGLALFLSILGLAIFRNAKVCALFLLIAGLALGFGRARLAEHQVTPETVDFYNGQTVQLEGIVQETDVRRDQAKYTVSMTNPKVKGDVLVTLDKYPQYLTGDRIRMSGKLEAPGTFDGFSYDHYLSRYGIYSVMYRPSVRLIRSGEGGAFWRLMAFFRDSFTNRVNHLFPEPHASFMAGLLVGSRKGIPPDITDRFNTTGLSHIVAISGFNITIILAFVLWALKGLPRKTGFWMAIGAVVLFTLFVGASPSVTRSAIMGILGLVALHHGRQSNIHLTVLYTAFFMTLWNPKILWWDIGFQLSFAAVLGLIYVSPHFKPWLERLPQTFGIREAIQMTLSAQLMAFPIIAFHFGRFSAIAPLSNLLVGFAIPPAMLLGFLAIAGSLLFSSVGLAFAYLASGVLAYILKVVDVLAAVPYASLTLPTFEIGFAIAYYTALITFLVFLFLKQQKTVKKTRERIREQ